MKIENLENWVDARIEELNILAERVDKRCDEGIVSPQDALQLKISTGAQLTAYKQVKHWIGAHK